MVSVSDPSSAHERSSQHLRGCRPASERPIRVPGKEEGKRCDRWSWRSLDCEHRTSASQPSNDASNGLDRHTLSAADMGSSSGRALPPLELRTKYWFEVSGRFAIGEGGIELLRAIAEHGSLARAAVEVGWSYRHAWGYLRRAERVLGVPLTSRRPGKGGRRGVDLTRDAHALLRLASRLASVTPRLAALVASVNESHPLTRRDGMHRRG
jgi:molybdate transport system regulatory protein